MTERTIIIDALLKVAVLLITSVLIPAIKNWIDTNVDNKQVQLVLELAKVAVKSVENDLATEEGLIKKQEAIERLADQIRRWGLKGFTAAELNHYIETAVKEMWESEGPGFDY